MTIPLESLQNTEILYSSSNLSATFQQPFSNHVILSSALDISHVQPNLTSFYAIIDPSP